MANGNGNGRIPVRDVAILLAAVAAGATGTWAYQSIDPPRPDPFTGTQAREMEARLRRDIERVENLIDEHLHFSQRKVEFYDRTLVEHTKDIASLKDRCDRAFKDR